MPNRYDLERIRDTNRKLGLTHPPAPSHNPFHPGDAVVYRTLQNPRGERLMHAVAHVKGDLVYLWDGTTRHYRDFVLADPSARPCRNCALAIERHKENEERKAAR